MKGFKTIATALSVFYGMCAFGYDGPERRAVQRLQKDCERAQQRTLKLDDGDVGLPLTSNVVPDHSRPIDSYSFGSTKPGTLMKIKTRDGKTYYVVFNRAFYGRNLPSGIQASNFSSVSGKTNTIDISYDDIGVWSNVKKFGSKTDPKAIRQFFFSLLTEPEENRPNIYGGSTIPRVGLLLSVNTGGPKPKYGRVVGVDNFLGVTVEIAGGEKIRVSFEELARGPFTVFQTREHYLSGALQSGCSDFYADIFDTPVYMRIMDRNSVRFEMLTGYSGGKFSTKNLYQNVGEVDFGAKPLNGKIYDNKSDWVRDFFNGMIPNYRVTMPSIMGRPQKGVPITVTTIPINGFLPAEIRGFYLGPTEGGIQLQTGETVTPIPYGAIQSIKN